LLLCVGRGECRVCQWSRGSRGQWRERRCKNVGSEFVVIAAIVPIAEAITREAAIEAAIAIAAKATSSNSSERQKEKMRETAGARRKNESKRWKEKRRRYRDRHTHGEAIDRARERTEKVPIGLSCLSDNALKRVEVEAGQDVAHVERVDVGVLIGGEERLRAAVPLRW
jgi:hypothetical protein